MQIKDLIPSLSVAFLMGIIIYSIKYIVINNDLILLTMQVLLGALIYIALCYSFKIEAFFNVLKIVRSFNIVKLKSDHLAR